MLGNVIVVSRARDLGVNRISIPEIMTHIRASNYSIFVPNCELPLFKASLPGEVDVLAEESLLGDWTTKRIAGALPAPVDGRAGWYLQQFLKIEAVRQLPALSEALIWDGDTVPLRPMNFKDSSGRVGFYVGREHHEPYFDTTRSLLRLGRAIPHSFVAQCMYVRVHWICALLAAIEDRSSSGWIEAILRSISGKFPSEFSEYETIGTFVANRWQSEMYLNHRPWFRWGMSHFGGVDRITAAGLRRLGRSYDYVALESWDKGFPALVRSRKTRLFDLIRYRALA
jgi:hypothetical protein